MINFEFDVCDIQIGPFSTPLPKSSLGLAQRYDFDPNVNAYQALD